VAAKGLEIGTESARAGSPASPARWGDRAGG
jgi:hypothetical protein